MPHAGPSTFFSRFFADWMPNSISASLLLAAFTTLRSTKPAGRPMMIGSVCARPCEISGFVQYAVGCSFDTHGRPPGGKSAAYGLNGHGALFVIDLTVATCKHTLWQSRRFTALFPWTPGPRFLKPGLKSTQKSPLTLPSISGLRTNWDKIRNWRRLLGEGRPE
jgi:hypothetical protein